VSTVGDYIKKALSDMTIEELQEEYSYQECLENIALSKGADPDVVYLLPSMRKEVKAYMEEKMKKQEGSTR